MIKNGRIVFMAIFLTVCGMFFWAATSMVYAVERVLETEPASVLTVSAEEEVLEDTSTTVKKVKVLRPKPIEMILAEEAESEVMLAKETESVEDVYETDSTEEPQATEPVEQETTGWQGTVLNAYLGTVQGPRGKETYYNLPMGGVVNIMRNLGYSEEEYPYWVREDGCKMLGSYIMVAANLNLRPRGTILETSLGWAIVCDTGTFDQYNATQIDIAVNW